MSGRNQLLTPRVGLHLHVGLDPLAGRSLGALACAIWAGKGAAPPYPGAFRARPGRGAGIGYVWITARPGDRGRSPLQYPAKVERGSWPPVLPTVLIAPPSFLSSRLLRKYEDQEAAMHPA